MEVYERRRIEAMMADDHELERLWREHLSLEHRLDELEAVRHRSQGEEAERKQLQKLKLSGRDRIAKIVAEREPGVS